jgi:hypothetical protein
VHDNPLYGVKPFKVKGIDLNKTESIGEKDKSILTPDEIIMQPVPHMRAMTISGLCIFLGITTETWGQYRKLEDFSDITHEADEIIRTQKFEGASADLLNANIIARDLGLKDSKDVTLGQDPDAPFNATTKIQYIEPKKYDEPVAEIPEGVSDGNIG